MGELRGSVDDPDGGDRHGRPERSGPQAPDTAVTRVGAELRSRTEYAADLEQRTVSGWEQRPFRPVMDGPAQASRTADAAGDPVARDKPLEALDRFEPRRAGLPDIAVSDAVTYLDSRQDTRPWLAGARDRPPEVQRVLAALDQGRGHAHIRHEGWVTEEMNERRVAFLEDPAQLDPAKRAARIDGLRQGEQLHGCRQAATRIVNPDAFASAFAKGIEHPKVRAALEAPYDPDDKPRPVQCRSGTCLARMAIGIARAGGLSRSMAAWPRPENSGKTGSACPLSSVKPPHRSRRRGRCRHLRAERWFSHSGITAQPMDMRWSPCTPNRESMRTRETL